MLVNYKYLLLLAALQACTLEPNITVDVPAGAIERTTAINVEWPDVRAFLQEKLDIS